MISSNKRQNGTTAIGKKAEEYEFGHIKVVYNKVKTEGGEKGKGVAARGQQK